MTHAHREVWKYELLAPPTCCYALRLSNLSCNFKLVNDGLSGGES
jgi:hypothetical protein